MGIREVMNRHPKITTGFVACVIAAGVGAIVWEIQGNNGKPPSKNYFTIDDGKTWFADSATQLPPFDHDGGRAVRCYVFQWKNGKFVGLLEKYSDATRQQLLQPANHPTSIPILAKKPGDKDWQEISADREAILLMQTKAPDGSDAEMIMP